MFWYKTSGCCVSKHPGVVYQNIRVLWCKTWGCCYPSIYIAHFLSQYLSSLNGVLH